MKLSPGVYFTSILREQIPNAQKNSKAFRLFALLGSAHVKGLCKMLVKLITTREKNLTVVVIVIMMEH
jgi:hypothetical protein